MSHVVLCECTYIRVYAVNIEKVVSLLPVSCFRLVSFSNSGVASGAPVALGCSNCCWGGPATRPRILNTIGTIYYCAFCVCLEDGSLMVFLVEKN